MRKFPPPWKPWETNSIPSVSPLPKRIIYKKNCNCYDLARERHDFFGNESLGPRNVTHSGRDPHSPPPTNIGVFVSIPSNVSPANGDCHSSVGHLTSEDLISFLPPSLR